MKQHHLTAASLVCWLTVAVAPAQDKKPDPDPDLPGQLKEFKAAAEDRDRDKDSVATEFIDRFLIAYPGMHSKDQKAVRGALKATLESARVRRDPEQKGIFVAAAYALGQMGADGAKILARAYDHKKFKPERDWVELRAVFLKNIGKTKDPKQVDFLLERALRDHSDHILRAAGEALGNYHEANERVRKEIAKELIKKYNEVHGQSLASLDPGDPQVKRAKETLAAISRDWNQSLQQITGQDIKAADEWLHFWNKNKGERWDK